MLELELMLEWDAELMFRQQYGKEKEAAAEAEAASAPSSAVTSGFGFFSSMLKKK